MRLARLRLLEADRQIQAMLVSDSWWLTAPLRALQRRWPRATAAAMLGVKLLAWGLSGQLPARLRGLARTRAGMVAAPAAAAPHAMSRGPPAGHRRILVVDERVPAPDRDAGSRSTLDILDTLCRAGWGVAFWPHDGQAADAAGLAARGIVVLGAGDPAAWLGAYGAELDWVLLMRPRPAAALLEPVLRHSHARIAYYGHDLHGLRLHRAAALARDPFRYDQAARELAAERRIWRAVDVVLYPSSVETELVRAHEPGVDARTLPLLAFATFPEPPPPPRADTMLFVGGFAHAPNADAAHWFVARVLPLVLAQRPAARVTLVGAAPPPRVRALAGPAVDVAGWLGAAGLAERYAGTRVVLAPLRFGAGVKGKVIDALQLGRPLVTTSIGAEGLPGLDRVVAVADDPAGFAAAIVALMGDDARWRAQAAAQIAYAKAHCSQAALRDALLAALGET